MFIQILFTQLKWTRGMLIAIALLTFTAPALAWRVGYTATLGEPSALAMLAGFSLVGPILAVTAIVGAFLLGAYPWTVDAAAKHVYPLSLPLPWSRYVAMRFGAGALSLLIPTLTLWLGSLLAIAMIQVPPTLRAYPGGLALRFLLASLLAYAATFALQHIAGRRSAAILLLLLVGGVILVGVASIFASDFGIASAIMHLLTDWPGPFAVFTADWMLLDV